MHFDEAHYEMGKSRAATPIGVADLTSTRKKGIRTWLREPDHCWQVLHSRVPEDAAVWRRNDCSHREPVREKANGQSTS